MHFSIHAIIAAIAFACFAIAAPAPEPQLVARDGWQQTVVKPYPIFDQSGHPFSDISCTQIRGWNWKGTGGARGVFGAIPYQGSGRQGWGIGGHPDVATNGAWGCGNCYQIWYNGRTAYMLAVSWGQQVTVGSDLQNYLTGRTGLDWNGIPNGAWVQKFDCPSYWQKW